MDLSRLVLLASADVGARLALAREAQRSGRAELVCLDWLSGSSTQMLELGEMYPIDAYPEPLRDLPSDLACVLWLLVRDGRFNETEPPRRRLPAGVNVISVVKRHLSGRGVARVGGWWLEIASWPAFVGKDRLPSREIRAQY